MAFVAAMTGPALPVGQLHGPFLFGFRLLELLLLRSGALPRAVPLLLIAGAALNAAGFATPEVRLTGVIASGAGIAWLGLAVLAGTRQTPALRDGLREPWAAAVSGRAGAR